MFVRVNIFYLFVVDSTAVHFVVARVVVQFSQRLWVSKLMFAHAVAVSASILVLLLLMLLMLMGIIVMLMDILTFTPMSTLIALAAAVMADVANAINSYIVLIVILSPCP